MEQFAMLFDLFRAGGFQLYLVGGCVRDLLMGRDPKDYDFATNARPPQVKRLLRAGGLSAIPIGEAFGTVATRIGLECRVCMHLGQWAHACGLRLLCARVFDNLCDCVNRNSVQACVI